MHGIAREKRRISRSRSAFWRVPFQGHLDTSKYLMDGHIPLSKGDGYLFQIRMAIIVDSNAMRPSSSKMEITSKNESNDEIDEDFLSTYATEVCPAIQAFNQFTIHTSASADYIASAFQLSCFRQAATPEAKSCALLLVFFVSI